MQACYSCSLNVYYSLFYLYYRCFGYTLGLVNYSKSQNWHHQAKIPPEMYPSYEITAWW